MEKGGGQKGREMYLSSRLSTTKCEIQMRNNCGVEQSLVQGDQSGLSIFTGRVLTKWRKWEEEEEKELEKFKP